MQFVNNIFRVRLLVGMCVVVLLLVGAAAFGGTIYVAEGASGAGSSWADAHGSLQDALDDASSGDEIWVAAGTYYPDPDRWNNPRRACFQMINGVAIYGGFDGTETSLEERDAQNNKTILSGDIGVPGEISDNCFHIFYHPDGTNLDASAILDGFTITAGNADGSSYPRNSGGGMYNHSSSPTVMNCIFSGNSANGEEANGGGMFNWDSNPTVTNCTFIGNSAGSRGGGMYNEFSIPTVTNCTFSGNSAGRKGGAMFNKYRSPILTNCILWGNTAINGGNEIYNNRSAPVISYCDIAGCLTGGAWNGSLGSDDGGNIDTNPLFVDAASGNLHLLETSPCINVGDNNAPSLGVTDFEGDARIIYGIVDMGADEVAGNVHFSLNVAIQPFAGAGTVTLDPAGGTYLPGTEITITVDAAEGYVFDHWSGDLAGNDNSATIIMDLHKYITAHFTFDGDIIYVDADATGLNNGTSWDDAFSDLQNALDDAISSDNIWVAEGTYKPSVEVGGTGDRYSTFQLINGVVIYGGFNGTETALEERDAQNNETILSGDIGVLGKISDNCYHVFYHPDGTNLDATAILDGFTITAGNADDDGGGMCNLGSSPTVTNCTFTGNSAGNRGGGMFNYEESSPTVSNCTFTDNSAGNRGGGMFNSENSSPTVTNCVFSDNSAYHGGGIYNKNSSPTVTNCAFSGNSAGNGGGIYNRNSSPTVTNCTFSDNSAERGGGMFNKNNSSPTVTGCTFIIGNLGNEGGNSANEGGGGMYNEFSNPIVIDCDFSGNSANEGGGGMYNEFSNPTVTNCTFSGNSADSGGGMYNRESSPTVSNCTFSGNSADDYGGGMYNRVNSSPTVTNCTFTDNSANGEYGRGAGMYNIYESNPAVSNCTFSDNSANEGGGMLNRESSSPTVTNCTFSGNSATWGGGMYNDDNSLIVTNCTFSGNSAAWGGGMFNWDSSPTVNNCTFSGNLAGDYGGGGMYNFYNSNPAVTNCIFWGDTAPNSNEIYNNSSRTVISYCDIAGCGGSGGGWDGSLGDDGGGNIDADPAFVDADGVDDIFGTEDDDLRLLVDSVCIDAGDPRFVADPDATDLDGQPRIIDGDGDGIGVVDMGAYEYLVSDPLGLLEDLAEYIIDLELKPGTENSLLVKLDAAISKLEDDDENNDATAINSLVAFINAVEAQSGKKIPEADAEALIIAAQQIVDLLGSE